MIGGTTREGGLVVGKKVKPDKQLKALLLKEQLEKELQRRGFEPGQAAKVKKMLTWERLGVKGKKVELKKKKEDK